MSDLNVSLSSSGRVGLESDKVSAQPASKKTETETENLVTETKAAEVNPKQEKKERVPEEMEVAVQEVNAFVQSMQRNLSFTIDEQLGHHKGI